MNTDIAKLLIKKEIKPSYQRIKILDYLVSNPNHPTVEQIYHDLVGEIPTLSKTTDYNSINLFIEAGIVQPINIEDHETRYDYNVSGLGHFKCIECGGIHDFQLESDAFATSHLNNYLIKEKNVYCKGICPICLENKNEKLKEVEQ
jgi:Fur family peroxide stress response transcriptional regulator